MTPITTASFALVSLSGILMLLHVRSGMVEEFHESLTILRPQGLRVSSEDERIADIARNNGKHPPEIITSLMAGGGTPRR